MSVGSLLASLRGLIDRLEDAARSRGLARSQVRNDPLVRSLTELEDTLSAMEQDVAVADLAKRHRELNRALETAEALTRLAATDQGRQKMYYTDFILSSLPSLKELYPYIFPQQIYEHPTSRQVTIADADDPDWSFVESLPIVLGLLLPGMFSYRKTTPIKLASGTLREIAPNSGQFVAELSSIPHLDLELVDLEFPTKVIEGHPLAATWPNLELYLPVRLLYRHLSRSPGTNFRALWARLAPRVPLCPVCSTVPDGDEAGDMRGSLCSLGHATKINNTIPEAFTLMQYRVTPKASQSAINREIVVGDRPLLVAGSAYPAKPPGLFREFFHQVSFDDQSQVDRVAYGVERRYTTRGLWDSVRIYYLRHDRPAAFGDKITTDSLQFQIARLPFELLSSVLKESPDLKRNLELQFLHAAMVDGISTAGLFETERLLRVTLKVVLKDKGIGSATLDELRSRMPQILRSKGAAKDYATLIPSVDSDPATISKHLNERAKEISSLDLSDSGFLLFCDEVLVHTLAHHIRNAAMKLAGASEQDVGYWYNKEGDEWWIHIFDADAGGNGVCDTARRYLYLPFVERVLQTRLEIAGNRPRTLPDSDFVTLFEDNLLECDLLYADRVLFDLVGDLPLKRIKECRSDAKKRSDLLQSLSESSYTFVTGIGPDLSFALSSGTAIVLKALGSLGINYDDLFVVWLCPEFFLAQLADRHYDLRELLGYDDLPGQIDALRQHVGLCVTGCVECVLGDPCGLGSLEMRYRVNTRLTTDLYMRYIGTRGMEARPEDGSAANEGREVLVKNEVLYLWGLETTLAVPQFLGVQSSTKLDLLDDKGGIYDRYPISSQLRFLHRVYATAGGVAKDGLVKGSIMAKLELS